MAHDNKADIKLANSANAGGVHTNLRRPDVFHEPKYILPPIVTAQKYGLTKRD